MNLKLCGCIISVTDFHSKIPAVFLAVIFQAFTKTTLKNHKIHFAFSYEITIENHSKDSVQLTSRHWEIFDSLNELETVRNYILGHFLRSVDGPFSLADKFKGIWEFGLDYSYFENYFAAIKTVTPKELRDLANKYLKEEDLIECVVGKI